MKIKLLILFAIILISGCNQNEKNSSFVLSGVINNGKENDIILLRINNKTVDSTAIKNDKFTFSGNLEKPTKALLFIKNSRDYNSIWLEKGKITIKGNRGNFKEAIVTGSKTQDGSNELRANLKDADTEWSKANNLLMTISKDDIRRDSLNSIFEKYTKIKDTINQTFISKNPNSLVSLNTLNIYKTSWGKEKTKELFSEMSAKNRLSEKGILIANFLGTPISPKIGEKYIAFSQPDKDGKLIKVSDIAKEYTLIEFWGSHCAPCRIANPKLVKIYKEHHKNGFEIIGVSYDSDKSDWLKAIEKDKLPWINVSELKGDNNTAANIYEVTVIPDNILIDKKGIIIARKIKADELEAFLEKKFGYLLSRLY